MRFTGPWVALLMFARGGPLVAADKPLNLLIVTADDMNADSAGWIGNKLGATPNPDAFAKGAHRSSTVTSQCRSVSRAGRRF